MRLSVSLGRLTHEVDSQESLEEVQTVLLVRAQRAAESGDSEAAELLEGDARFLGREYSALSQGRLMPESHT